MKKFYLLNCIFFLIAFSNANAQSWAQPGATWYYGVNPGSGGVSGYIKISKTADTLIQTHICDVLQKRAVGHSIFFTPPDFDFVYGFEYTYVENNIVYHWRQNQFFVLYDFTAPVGGTWEVAASPVGVQGCGASGFVEISQTGIMTAGGQNRNYQTVVTSNFSNYGFSNSPSTIIEGIGNSESFIPDFTGCIADANEMYLLRCYSDSSGFLYDTGIAPSCDYITAVIENKNNNKLVVSPNPAKEKFQLSNFQFRQGDKLYVTDVTGKIIFTQNIAAPVLNVSIEMPAAKPGIYFLEIKTANASIVRKLALQPD